MKSLEQHQLAGITPLPLISSTGPGQEGSGLSDHHPETPVLQDVEGVALRSLRLCSLRGCGFLAVTVPPDFQL